MVRSFEMSVDSDLRQVEVIARGVRAFCSDVLAAGDIDGLEISVVEATNNIIIHGYGNQPGHKIKIRLAIKKCAVWVDVFDQAPPMASELLDPDQNDPFDVDADDIVSLPEGGMGLALIKMNIDEVIYRRVNGENLLRMIKRVSISS